MTLQQGEGTHFELTDHFAPNETHVDHTTTINMTNQELEQDI